ncbi:uncharacterized protein LOC114941875 [Nylanderia fulva]|uniref:uncharacterized protein LOC114941875 n=1 Tax=Nylanderia fulva TaxID=613905 RepID=UPI0010FB65F2|nr:uncharacterized protein LOC114941875 [Nylanderia fulva]
MSMDERDKNIESVSNKDCNEKIINVTSNADCHHKPTLLNAKNKGYDIKEDEIPVIIDNCDYQEITDLPVNFDIGTIIFTDENESIETVMPSNFFMNDNIEAAEANISLSDSFNGSIRINECVRRLSFNMTETDARRVSMLSPCRDDVPDPEIVAAPVSYNNDKNESDDEDSEYIPSEHSSLNNESPQKQVSIVNRTILSTSSFDTSNTNVVGTSACNDEVICNHSLHDIWKQYMLMSLM